MDEKKELKPTPTPDPLDAVNPAKAAKPSGYSDADWNRFCDRKKITLLWSMQSNEYKRKYRLAVVLGDVKEAK